jgi:hypothetical protein
MLGAAGAEWAAAPPIPMPIRPASPPSGEVAGLAQVDAAEPRVGDRLAGLEAQGAVGVVEQRLLLRRVVGVHRQLLDGLRALVLVEQHEAVVHGPLEGDRGLRARRRPKRSGATAVAARASPIGRRTAPMVRAPETTADLRKERRERSVVFGHSLYDCAA